MHHHRRHQTRVETEDEEEEEEEEEDTLGESHMYTYMAYCPLNDPIR